ncbi:MAG: CRISPR-associated protein Cas4 [Erysipelotrichaceae bacterium]|nr:CRISPR-associated protein Cas4 [Erysipelotrichaceae bacterium]
MTEDDFLSLSGIQHFIYCRRQWALIHIEKQWQESGDTVQGKLFHHVVEDEDKKEKRKEVIITRAVRVKSSELKISGICDVIEFHRNNNGIKIGSWEGKWIPYPVEYKKGSPKEDDSDILQLCAEAMCLEEMLCCDISEGALFYGEIKRRQIINFDQELKERTKNVFIEMWKYYNAGWTPKQKYGKKCRRCSMYDLCIPKLTNSGTVEMYIEKTINEE